MARHKAKKPLYKKWWFWLVLVVFGIGALGAGGEDDGDDFPVRETVVAEDTAASSIETPDEKGWRLTDEAAAEDMQEQRRLSAEAQEGSLQTEPATSTLEPVQEEFVPMASSSSESESPAPDRMAQESQPEPEPEPAPKTEPKKVTASVHGTNRTVSLEPGTLVWLSATGSKFHDKNDCGNMNPDKARQVTVEYATQQGFDACERCY